MFTGINATTTVAASSQGITVYVRISRSDLELVSQYRWRVLNSDPSRPYAVAYKNGKSVFMHRLICDPPDGLLVDHINGDTLDNRRENLRPATIAQNSRNSRKHIDGSTPFKGVYQKDGRRLSKLQNKLIGSFPTAAHAALAYNDIAVSVFGAFARLNDLSNFDVRALRATMSNGARPRTSQYRGVSFIGGTKKPWRAVKRLAGKDYRLGIFVTETDAALAIDNFGLRHGLDDTEMNFPEWPVRTYRERTREQGITGRLIRLRYQPSH